VDEKLQEIEQRFERLTADLGNPEVIGDRARFSQVAKERAQLEQLVETFREYKRVKADLEGNQALLQDSDTDVRAMAKEELPGLQERLSRLNELLKILLLPKDPNDERSVILEVRAGAGGDEAGLFAAELLRMYLRYAERKGWRFTLMDTSDNAAGGIKDASVTIEGAGIFSAIARFLICDFSCWHFTTTPVGLWVRRTAESVVFTLWPPAPVERITSI